jgi:hypothetical protein
VHPDRTLRRRARECVCAWGNLRPEADAAIRCAFSLELKVVQDEFYIAFPTASTPCPNVS